MTDFSEMFDPSQYQGTTYDLLPIGIYSAQIIEAEVTVPQSQDGQGVKVVWSITEGGLGRLQDALGPAPRKPTHQARETPSVATYYIPALQRSGSGYRAPRT
jgi:hypothetical protein